MASMDCRTALDLLEAARPDSDDLESRDLESAAAHLRECPQCTSRFEKRQAFDRSIGRLMRDVPLPPQLKENLLAELQAEAARTVPDEHRPGINTGAGQQPGSKISRRKWLTRSITAAICLMAGLAGWWILRPQSSDALSLEQIRQRLHSTNYHLASLPEFDGNFSPTLPSGGWTSGGLHFTGSARGFQMNYEGKHLMALYEFRFAGREDSSLTGVLVVIPEYRVQDSPEALFFSPNAAGYIPVLNTAWKSDGLVYICLIPHGDARSLELLQRNLQSGLV